MAVDHFNSRDPLVVPQLKNLDCNVSFGAVSVLDTGTNGHLSMHEMIKKVELNGLPDAIAGPFNEIPAFELSVIATTLKIPIVAHRAFDNNLLQPEQHPYFSQVSADATSEVECLVSYLKHTNRTNYIAVVYASSASAMQKVDIFRVLAESAEMDQIQTFSYNYHHFKGTGLPDTSIRHALQHVKDTGYRTIVWISEEVRMDTKQIHEAASDLGLDQGDHFWIQLGGVSELSSSEQLQHLSQSNATFGPHNYLQGSAYLTPYDGFELTVSPFPNVLFSRNRSFVERLEAYTPIDNYYDWSNVDYAGNFTFGAILNDFIGWWMGSSYIYDAVMAIGMGACQATAGANGQPWSGDAHLKGVRSVDFVGATGRIAFDSTESGGRKYSTVPFSIVNMLPPGTNK